MTTRLDRLFTLGCVQPLRRMTARDRESHLPILMYHSVSDGSQRNGAAYYETSTTPEVFAVQMELLQKRGYAGVSLSQARQSPGSGKPAALTFDDGFRDFYTTAFPILRQHGFSATVFLPTGFVGKRFKDRECMTWNEARELRKAGIEFGSHTANHPVLHELGADSIRNELEVSKTTIEDELGERITAFAYPYAFPSANRQFVETLTGLLKGAGYECAVTTRIGRVRRGDDPFTLKRLPINAADDERLFQAKLTGAYDWMALPQNSFKHWKRFVPIATADATLPLHRNHARSQ